MRPTSVDIDMARWLHEMRTIREILPIHSHRKIGSSCSSKFEQNSLVSGIVECTTWSEYSQAVHRSRQTLVNYLPLILQARDIAKELNAVAFFFACLLLLLPYLRMQCVLYWYLWQRKREKLVQVVNNLRLFNIYLLKCFITVDVRLVC